MISFVENLLRQGLKPTEDMPDLQTERAHESVGSQPPDDTLSRSIIITFLSYQKKRDIAPQDTAEEGIYLAGKS